MESFREGIEKDYRLWCSADDAYGVSLVGILPAGETHRLDRDVAPGILIAFMPPYRALVARGSSATSAIAKPWLSDPSAMFSRPL